MPKPAITMKQYSWENFIGGGWQPSFLGPTIYDPVRRKVAW
jgi:hypothetical protein